jgi:hypothetical protein
MPQASRKPDSREGANSASNAASLPAFASLTRSAATTLTILSIRYTLAPGWFFTGTDPLSRPFICCHVLQVAVAVAYCGRPVGR